LKEDGMKRWPTRESRNPFGAPLGVRRGDARGQILVLFAFILVALLAVSALAVDYGGWLLARRSFQDVSDAAVLAGAAQLTTPITETCTGPFGGTKNDCAREAAWTSLKDALHLTSLSPHTQSLGPNFTIPYVENGYKIWVASPPSDAGTKYPGSISNQRTIFVWVERVEASNLARIVRPAGQTISAWATAGRIPQNFAFIGLCYPGATLHLNPDCRSGSGEDVTIDGGSTVVLHTGDMGVNTWVKTNGVNAYVALGTDSGAYMGKFSTCWSSGSCQMVSWVDPPGVIGGARQAIPLGPQIQDPQYPEPPTNNTTVPWQCRPVGTGTTISMLPNGDFGPSTAQEPQMLPVSFIKPLARPAIPLAVDKSGGGTVTDASFGGNLAGALVEARTTSGTLVFTNAPGTGVNGTYSFTLTKGTTYNITVSKTNYISQTKSIVWDPSGTEGDFALVGNPGTLTGTVKSTAAGNPPIPNATVQVAGGGSSLTDAFGAYTITNVAAGNRLVTASASGFVTSSPIPVVMPAGGPANLPIFLGPTGTIQGTVTFGGSPMPGVSVTVTGGGSATTNGAGFYSISNVLPGSRTVTASLAGYVASPNPATVTVAAAPPPVTQNFTLSPVPTATVTGTITDGTTGLAIPGATVSITGPSTGTSPATTNASGTYTITGLTLGSGYRITASRSGYTTSPPSNAFTMNTASPPSYTQNVALWPARCGVGNSNYAQWDCANGAGGCPAVINPAGGNVSCTFNDWNRIRPGTYKDITIGANQCAWIDPTGDPTGMQSGAMPGIVHVTNSISIGSNAFLFGDGVTIVLDQSAAVNVGNSGGFVLNYPTLYTPSANPTCDMTTVSTIGDPVCFRHVPPSASADAQLHHDGNDYSYGAWAVDIKTKNAISPWTNCATPSTPAYNLTCVSSGVQERSLGITWYLRGSATKRFYFNGQMGFLFNGVLYGPQDNIKIGGQGAQASAGQIIGWTIEYAGGTNIHHRYAGIQTDGPPYLIEPYLGQ
jgi:carboxypeptidase family protein/putative Flp pilus-assembly TadE/G-like protein